MLEPPAPSAQASFVPEFGQRTLLTVDTEEEFDWEGPFSADGYGLDHVSSLRRFQEFCEGLGVCPVYLVDWPIVTSDLAGEILGDAISRGKAEVGIQLHPWVNPPKTEQVNEFNSFAGNLPHDLEREKFTRLRDAIEDRFKAAPVIYRAGRYGLGPQSAGMLKKAGVAIDTSVRSNFDYSAGYGPNYARHPLTPYWVDAGRQLLELPVTTPYWGMLRKQGKVLEPLIKRLPAMSGLFTKLGLLEKIPLTPEGVTPEEALRGIDMAVDDGLPVIVLSFHSPSLAPGFTPYVRSEQDLDDLYDWFRRVYAYCDSLGVKPTSVAEIMKSVINA